MTEEKLWRALGYRDALAEHLAEVRSLGAGEALRRAAEVLLRLSPGHPHAEWYLREEEGSKG